MMGAQLSGACSTLESQPLKAADALQMRPAAEMFAPLSMLGEPKPMGNHGRAVLRTSPWNGSHLFKFSCQMCTITC